MDLVLQTHLNPQGKPENVRPRLGLHFTSQAPANKAFRLRLTALELDIPAGTSNYVAEMSYPLPKDLSFVRVGGHAHYLCKEMQGYAILPGGAKKWLLFIRNWDFKWQGDYEYKTPVDIPKGSTIVMRFTYDNSTNNVRNPFSPPRRVLHGPETTDEMGELYFQTMPRDQADYEALLSDYLQYDARVNIDYYRFRLKMNPGDAEALLKLGRALAWIGRTGEAITYLEKLARLEPTNDLPHFDLGSIYLRQGRASRAYQEFRNVVRLNPEDGQAYESLGIICAQTHRLDEAREHFMKALRIDPEDTLAAQYLQRLNAQER
jgi:tetratricopeptide (TPR) repeat protein